MSECEAFLQAIAANEDDITVRLVFADWLDEQGEHEEAERQRKWHEGKQWLIQFCQETTDILKNDMGFTGEMTYVDALELGRQISNCPRLHMNSHSFERHDGINYLEAIGDARLPKFLRNWSIVTGKPIKSGYEQISTFQDHGGGEDPCGHCPWEKVDDNLPPTDLERIQDELEED